MLQCFKKYFNFFFLPLKIWKKKHPKKLLIIRPDPFFSVLAQKQKSCATKSPLMQDWVFRLGFQYSILLIRKPTKPSGSILFVGNEKNGTIFQIFNALRLNLIRSQTLPWHWAQRGRNIYDVMFEFNAPTISRKWFPILIYMPVKF